MTHDWFQIGWLTMLIVCMVLLCTQMNTTNKQLREIRIQLYSMQTNQVHQLANQIRQIQAAQVTTSDVPCSPPVVWPGSLEERCGERP